MWLSFKYYYLCLQWFSDKHPLQPAQLLLLLDFFIKLYIDTITIWYYIVIKVNFQDIISFLTTATPENQGIHNKLNAIYENADAFINNTDLPDNTALS